MVAFTSPVSVFSAPLNMSSIENSPGFTAIVRFFFVQLPDRPPPLAFESSAGITLAHEVLYCNNLSVPQLVKHHPVSAFRDTYEHRFLMYSLAVLPA